MSTVGPAIGRPSLAAEAAGGLHLAKRVRAYVGLGANVGDARATLERAVRALAALPGVRLRGVSRLYATKPVGFTDQPDFLNAAVGLDVPAGPDPETGALALLSALKQLELALGRRPRGRWGPREIDLDLLTFGRHRISVEQPEGLGLEVPHPLARERLFVLAPLSDLAPGLRPGGWGESVESARRRLEAVEDAGQVREIGSLAAD
jgi:2-amino-4-hydroxy-6-hydroxymethyldihydropteridine diphosphokinase